MKSKSLSFDCNPFLWSFQKCRVMNGQGDFNYLPLNVKRTLEACETT